MNRAYPVLAVLLLAGCALAAISSARAQCGRSDPANSPPYVKADIPDFTIFEHSVNKTMRDLDLYRYFSDPDLPPAGNDSLNFSVDNSSFPAFIMDDALTFGTAPVFPGKDAHQVFVNVTATDRGGLTARQMVNITVINLYRPLITNESANKIEIPEDGVSYFDLNRMFENPYDDPLTFVYLGGATENLSVEVAPNGTAVFRPAPDYYTRQEIIRIKACAPGGSNSTGELIIRIRNVPDVPYVVLMAPDPLDGITIDENHTAAFQVTAADVDNKTSELRYAWYIDGVERALPGNCSFAWRPTFDDAGPHVVKVRISDGLSYIDAGWNVTVKNLNRAPVVLDLWPINNTEVVYNAKITFRANATDPDGDPMTFYWRLSDGTLLKTETGKTSSTFSKILSGGKQHIVVLEIQDGEGGVSRQYLYIKVGPKHPVSPPSDACFPFLFMTTPIILTAATASVWRRNGR